MIFNIFFFLFYFVFHRQGPVTKLILNYQAPTAMNEDADLPLGSQCVGCLDAASRPAF